MDALGSTAADLLLWSWRLYAAPAILGLGLIAALGRVFQLGPARMWPKAAYVALEVAVEAVRLLIMAVVIGLGDLAAGFRRTTAFFMAGDLGAALTRLGVGWMHHWPQALAAIGAFVIVAVILNVIVFAIAPLVPLRRLADAAGVPAYDDAGSKTAVVLFIKNLTIIPFTMVWLWGLLLFLSK